ncbi:Vps51/Vps67-domain-containing protein [Pterulicium gracile]|uniref:Vacuolar protein sorting-associated protein 51 homolog n=1 Tax=Pterulicium gracile TaxID=1884261 RepID=A0A5C3QG12_9AGAR|nr:Vps51/Vps67-domain-containing protein [Pterula gracilis]
MSSLVPSSSQRERRPSIPRPPPTPTSPQPKASASLPANIGRPGHATPPKKSSAARDMLRKHYGLGVGPPPPLANRSTNDPMDMDSPAFDAKSYYEQLITTSTLPALLKRENELMTEIRELDSERQSLVYNHHHELIAASDTIAAMKTRADTLDGDLDLLRMAFSEISRLSAQVALENGDISEDAVSNDASSIRSHSTRSSVAD